jgi:hypothetical protein
MQTVHFSGMSYPTIALLDFRRREAEDEAKVEASKVSQDKDSLTHVAFSSMHGFMLLEQLRKDEEEQEAQKARDNAMIIKQATPNVNDKVIPDTFQLEPNRTETVTSPQKVISLASSNPKFGMALWGFLPPALKPLASLASSEATTRLSKAVDDNLANSPDLQDLKDKEPKFSHAVDRVHLAAKLAPSDPNRAKLHLEEAQKLFHSVADNRKLHELYRAESSSHAMEIARQLNQSPAEINHHADKTSRLTNEAQTNGPTVISQLQDHAEDYLVRVAGLAWLPALLVAKVLPGIDEEAMAKPFFDFADRPLIKDKKRKQDIEDLKAHVKNVRESLRKKDT